MATIGVRLANVVLFIVSCSVAAGVITDVTASVVIPSRVPTPPAVAVEAPVAMRWQDRQVILDRNLFEAQVSGEGVEDLAEPEEDIEETKLPLKLLGTIASEDQRVASAAIESQNTRQHEVVKVGDALTSHSDVNVERIDRGRVILRNGARREELLLDEDVAAIVKQSPPPRQNRRVSRREARRNRQARANVRDRMEDLAEQGGPTSPAAIFSQARILPKYENGAMVGIELSKIKDDSFFQKAGLNDGDVVTSLNGIAIDSPTASAQLLGAINSNEPIVAEVMDSSGQIRTVTADPSEMNFPFFFGRPLPRPAHCNLAPAPSPVGSPGTVRGHGWPRPSDTGMYSSVSLVSPPGLALLRPGQQPAGEVGGQKKPRLRAGV